MTDVGVNSVSVTTPESGTLIGVGVGPGDPELLTLKAFRFIQQAPVISYLCNSEGESQARTIARLALAERGHRAEDIAIEMPMSTDRRAANRAYDEAADRVLQVLATGRDVVFLCEGDPLFFGSFAYVLERLAGRVPCAVVPGISSVNAAAAQLCQPLTRQSESFAVVSGRHSDADIEAALRQHSSVVIMKAGQARPRILDALVKTGRTGDARYLEYIGRDHQRIETDVNKLSREAGPYFSLFVVTGEIRKPMQTRAHV